MDRLFNANSGSFRAAEPEFNAINFINNETIRGIAIEAVIDRFRQPVFAEPGIFTGPFTTGPAVPGPVVNPGSPSSTGPSVVSSPPDDLVGMIRDIPYAYDGQVITSGHHNSLREALLALARRSGIDPGSATGGQTFLPFFRKHEDAAEWTISFGVATVNGGTAAGWFPVYLPQGARIQTFTVKGRRSGTITGPFEVKLVRVTIADGGNVTLINVALNGAADPFSIDGTVQIPGTGPLALEEYKTVDNSLYTYLVLASAESVAAGAVAQINAIQIAYS